MVRLIALILLCVVCCSTASARFAFSQNLNRLTEVNFRVRGIGLGSSYAVALRQLGQPVSSKRERILDEYEVCGPPYTLLQLSYEGALAELRGDLRGRKLKVVSMEVTSPKLLIAPGIKIGMTENDIRSKLGVPWRVRNESGFRILDYVTKGNDGGAGLYLVAGRLVKVQWEYTLC